MWQVAEYPEGPGVAAGPATGPSPSPAARSGRGPIRGRPRADLQEFGEKSPWWLPPPKGLSRQVPQGSTTQFQSQLPFLLQKRLVGGSALPPGTFSPVHNTSSFVDSTNRTLAARGDQLTQAVTVRVRNRGPAPEPGASDVGGTLCPGDEVTRGGSECCEGAPRGGGQAVKGPEGSQAAGFEPSMCLRATV